MSIPLTPEAEARQIIDEKLSAAGWQLQDYGKQNFGAGRGIALREAPMVNGYADYLLLVDGKALGVVEAKKAGATLSSVELQTKKYGEGPTAYIPTWQDDRSLPFLYESNGAEIYFTDTRDPVPRSRKLFGFHRPETLAGWTRDLLSLRQRLRTMPPLEPGNLWRVQVEAIHNVETSLAHNRPRALVQMATGSGKTYMAINLVYRLIKHASARRVLFLVDRTNLGTQAERAFHAFDTPDDGRKFSELYNIQHLQSNVLDDVSCVHISTIQRLYSILSGVPVQPEEEEPSLYEREEKRDLIRPERQVLYDAGFPVEYYDVIVVDECHRSIYNVWRDVLEYFDAFLVGLTATPSKRTIAYFNKNLVMEYGREKAVADGINVPGLVYRIRTRITEEGSAIPEGFNVRIRDTATRAERQELLDEELAYDPTQLDRSVTSPDQIRTIIRTFRDKLFAPDGIFPGRSEVPKTLIFAKTDDHAEDVVRIVREEFDAGNDFCQKVTYKVSGDPEQIVTAFRTSYDPRIAVTVDLISTGTDIKPLEIVFFLRDVKSRTYFEQMLGRGVRVVSTDELRQVTSDAATKDHFVIVDAVGVSEHAMVDTTRQLDRQPTVPLNQILNQVSFGSQDPDVLSTLAGRLARLQHKMTAEDHEKLQAVTDGRPLSDITHALLAAVDPDAQQQRAAAELAVGAAPTAEQVAAAAAELAATATQIFITNADFRDFLLRVHERQEKIIDEPSLDELIDAGFSGSATDHARQLVASFEEYIETHKDEIDALQILYSRPHKARAETAEQVKALGDRIADGRPVYELGTPESGAPLTYERLQTLRHKLREAHPYWTTERLWLAYEQLEKGRARDASAGRTLTDLITLVRHAIAPEDSPLVPYADLVRRRYQDWLAAQEANGRAFTAEQRWWLDRIAESIGLNLHVTPDDVDRDMYERGGRFGAERDLGSGWRDLLEELNKQLSVMFAE
jgi:type I restriction enzyme, R subunit